MLNSKKKNGLYLDPKEVERECVAPRVEADEDLELEAGERDLLAPPFLRLSLHVNYYIN
jgi:hypothetical protein